MSSVEELGTALECIVGARQALARILADDVDDTLSRAVTAVDSRLSDQHTKLCDLSQWRREVER